MMGAGAKPGPIVVSVWSGTTTPSKQRALDLLGNLEWKELHLRLPKDWEDALLALREGFDIDSVLAEMSEMGQVKLPEDAQVVRSWRPFLERLWDLAGEREVHCFRDPIAFSHQRQIALDMAAESVKARLGFLDLSAWRELLQEDVQLYLSESLGEGKLIARRADEGTACVDLSPEAESLLADEGFRVHTVRLEGHELPLSRLKREIMILESRREEVPDSLIELGVRKHLEFLEILLSADSFDEACLAWSEKETGGKNGS